MTIMTWTRELLDEFTAARDRAVAENQDSFWFHGHEFVVSYANYVIEYLEGHLA